VKEKDVSNLLIATVLIGASVLWPKTIAPKDAGKSQDRANPDTNQGAGPVGLISDKGQNRGESDKHNSIERWYWKRQYQLGCAGIFINFFILVAAAWAFAAAWNAYVIGIDTLREARIQTEQAQRQAKAAENQVAIAADAEIRQLRAYLVVSSRELENYGDNKIGRVPGIWENLGQTPIYDATWVSGINVLPCCNAMVNISYNTCQTVMDASINNKNFFGKFSYPVKDRDSAFTPSEIQDIKGGRSAVYFHGRVCYRDIFKKLRRTDFCILWRWDAGSNALSKATYCGSGNDAD
jgi:hypothetical protein